MFSDAYQIATAFTKPVMISQLNMNGDVGCGLASFVVINNEGWFLSSAHVLQTILDFEDHKDKIADYEERIAKIEGMDAKNKKVKARLKRKVGFDARWIKRVSYWWGRDGVKVADNFIYHDADLMVGRLEPFDASWVAVYPKLIPADYELRPGTSVCKLGFPFYSVKATYDEANRMFHTDPATFPPPYFPIEGLITREVRYAQPLASAIPVKFLETSSPGLRGQSGGPIFDTHGNVWAIQSRTSSLPLGFQPKVIENGRENIEHQFLNVGMGTHYETVAKLLDHHGIEYEAAYPV